MTEVEALKKQIEELQKKLDMLSGKEIIQGNAKISRDDICNKFKLCVNAEHVPNNFGGTRNQWRSLAYADSTKGIIEKMDIFISDLTALKGMISGEWADVVLDSKKHHASVEADEELAEVVLKEFERQHGLEKGDTDVE